MESQLQRPHDHTSDDPQNASAIHSMVEDEGEHHHEKKSVLNKVKAKAKKIKDTLTKHGHGHEQEHEQDYHHDSEEDEDEDDEMVEDPEIHDAPIYESAAVKSAIPSQDMNLEKKPLAIGEDRYGTRGSDQIVAGPGLQGQDQYSGQSGINLERPKGTELSHAARGENESLPSDIHGTRPRFTDQSVEEVQEQGARIGEPQDLKEVPNYETKVTDPTGKGGEEAEMTPLNQSLDKMSVSDETVPKAEANWEQSGYTGSHDQFAPQSYPTADEVAPNPSISSSEQGGSESIPKSCNPSKPEELPRDTLTGKLPDQSGYMEKISTATSAIANKAISAKNIVAAKLGYGGSEGTKGQELGEGKEGVKSTSPSEYAHKVAATVTEKLAPVYENEKVADAGSSVISNVKTSTNAGKDERPEVRIEGEGKLADKGVFVKEYLTEKLRPSDEDKALSEVISETLHKKKEDSGKTKESKPMGKVTESGEVARRLGSGTETRREGEDAIAAGNESTGKGVVGRIKDAVNLWVGKGGEGQHYEGSPGSLVGGGSSAAGEVEEQRLQESIK